METIDSNTCPLCGQPNGCGTKGAINGIELLRCWCAYETFPEEVLRKVPKEKQGVACICRDCLIKNRNSGSDNGMKLQKVLTEFADHWQQHPEISWSEIFHTGEKLLAWQEQQAIAGFLAGPVKMVTATLDDAMGQGLKMIHLYSRIMGIDIIPLGLMQTTDSVITECVKQHPDFLGLTVLQFDTEEELDTIIREIPQDIRLIVGGPVFKFMDQEELDDKKYTVLNTTGEFIRFFCNGIYKP